MESIARIAPMGSVALSRIAPMESVALSRIAPMESVALSRIASMGSVASSRITPVESRTGTLCLGYRGTKDRIHSIEVTSDVRLKPDYSNLLRWQKTFDPDYIIVYNAGNKV